jgi:hypothetical protein
MTFANKTNLGEGDQMKKLIQVLIVSGLILVMGGGTAQGHDTIQQGKFKRNNEKNIMLYAHITDFEHKHDSGRILLGLQSCGM